MSFGARGRNPVSGIWFLDDHPVRVKDAGGVVTGSEVGRLPSRWGTADEVLPEGHADSMKVMWPVVSEGMCLRRSRGG